MLSILARSARLEGPENPPAPGAGPRLAAPPTNTTITTSSPAGALPLPAPGDQPEIKLPKVTIRREVPKVGRNEPCPCGSGKKYKQCCGK
jgi:preprotein translocase subunit SecA